MKAPIWIALGVFALSCGGARAQDTAADTTNTEDTPTTETTDGEGDEGGTTMETPTMGDTMSQSRGATTGTGRSGSSTTMMRRRTTGHHRRLDERARLNALGQQHDLHAPQPPHALLALGPHDDGFVRPHGALVALLVLAPLALQPLRPHDASLRRARLRRYRRVNRAAQHAEQRAPQVLQVLAGRFLFASKLHASTCVQLGG
jgi:hypothetical protein